MNVIRNKFEDNVVVNSNELAESMRCSRYTILRWKKEGYKFLYGNRTTTAHFKEWLKSKANSESKAIESALAGLN